MFPQRNVEVLIAIISNLLNSAAEEANPAPGSGFVLVVFFFSGLLDLKKTPKQTGIKNK